VVSVYVPHGRDLDHWHYRYKLDFLAPSPAAPRTGSGRRATWSWPATSTSPRPTATSSTPDAFAGRTHVSAPERDALAHLYEAGLVDVDVAVWGARSRRFTWWDHGIGYSRNLGMRIDHIAADRSLAARIDTTWIDHAERGGERPSDHAALVADFHRP
jgi:exodeoxyribonuclease-3